MKSHDSKSDHSDKHKDKSGDMRSDKPKDRDAKRAEKKLEREAKRAEKMKEREAKHAEKMKEKEAKHAEKMKDKDKTGTTTTANGTPAANGGKDDLYGKGIVGPNTNLKPVPGTPAPGATPGPSAGNNTIHPIPGTAAPAPATGSGNGIIRITDQRGNSIIIPDHGTGVTVTPAGPGHVTISNGADSRTVSGIALTISGAKTVSVDKSLGTGRPPADGSTVVLTPNGTVTNERVLPDGSFEAHPVNQ
jgi:hypothetical protein